MSDTDTDTVGRLRARLDDVRALVDSVPPDAFLDPADILDAVDGGGDDDGHGPWYDMGGAVLCSCRYPVDKDERCTRPRHLDGQYVALTSALFEAADALLERFDYGPADIPVAPDDDAVEDLRCARDALAAWGEKNADALAGSPVLPSGGQS